MGRKSSPEFEEVNDVLISLTGRLGNILTYAKENMIEPTIDFVQLELAKKREYYFKSRRVDLFEQLDKYIEEKRTKVTDDVI